MKAYCPSATPGSRTRVMAVACMAAALSMPAAAQETGGDKPAPIKLQLNKAETAGDACRTTFLIDNSRGGAMKTYKVDLFAFDTDGVAQKRITVDLGPLSAHKTVVKLFDFGGIPCAKIGRILLNDVLACDGGDSAREACLDRTEIESKTSIPFDR